MALVKWDPFELRSLWRWPSVWEDEDSLPNLADSRQLDVYETGDEVIVKASVAGVKPNNVDITFEKGILWVRGEEEEEEKKGKKYYKKSARSYSYKVAVPGNVDLKKEPEANIEDGVLTVSFKKTEEAKPRKIAIKTKKKK